MERIGRYKIVRELGRGAMGVVYHAIDPNIGRPVAIKTIQLGSQRNAEEQNRLRERLFREARSAGMLSHPGIVTIYDVEQHGDVAYIAMEYVDGPTLDQMLSGEEALTPERMFSILGQTSVALDYAHQKGIVHRDIKPANIMIARDGTAKITDFGIAKITASEQMTMTGSIVGTPHYMSPEQVQGQPVDGRSDQFSLAVIAFEMLTGEKPYTGEHLTTVVYKIVAEEPVAPHRLNPSLTGAIEAVLRKGLAKKPDARYRTCQEFIDALEKACTATRGWKAMTRGGSLNEPTVADVPRPPVTLPPPRHPARAEATATAGLGAKRKSGFLPFLGAILVMAALLALIGWQADPSLPQRFQWLSQKWQTLFRPAATPTGGSPAATGASPASAGGAQGAAKPLSNGASAPVQAPAEPKPSPLLPVQEQPESPAKAEKPPSEEPTAPVKKAEPRAPRAAAAQPLSIISSPGGATATMDGRPDQACTTPCTLTAFPGRHAIAVTLPGYQAEHREVLVGSGPQELPPVILRAPAGTLMLSSVPSGAAVLVDGRRFARTTPAQVPLTPGSHEITVERDGRQITNKVEIRNGEIKSLKILLEP